MRPRARASSRGSDEASRRPPISIGAVGVWWMPCTTNFPRSESSATRSSLDANQPASRAAKTDVDLPEPLRPNKRRERSPRPMAPACSTYRPWRASSQPNAMPTKEPSASTDDGRGIGTSMVEPLTATTTSRKRMAGPAGSNQSSKPRWRSSGSRSGTRPVPRRSRMRASAGPEHVGAARTRSKSRWSHRSSATTATGTPAISMKVRTDAAR